MQKVVPSHSLVIAVSPSQVNREQTLARYFPDYEILSAANVTYNLVGEKSKPEINSIVFAEIRHRIQVKLDLGERVVVDAPNLRREDRMSLARLGSDIGVPVFYFLCDPAGADEQSVQRFYAAEKDLLRGDGLAEVIDWRIHQPSLVDKTKPDLESLKANWNGITVIGDVHGMYQSLLSALDWARSRNHYMIFLGDVIDYGSDTLEVADEVYRVVMRGQGEMILGNHERKIMRWINQIERGRTSVRLSDGNKVTTDALGSLGLPARKRWQGRFKGLVSRSSHWRVIGNILFTHAGVHPGFWTGSATAKELETWALFGEFDANYNEERPARRYTWTENVPADMTVIVGHDIRSTAKPMTVVNSNGGNTIFLDTGSGKGGRLSSAALRIDGDGLKVANFNMY
jgi:protein phosphatase